MAGQMVTFPLNGKTGEGYLATPSSGTGPGVIVLQEWWGLVDHIKRVTDRFADAGYVALAPDMYHGKKASHPDEAGRHMMQMSIAETEKDLKAAAAFLKTKSATRKIGSVGFCLGGQLALFAATLNPDFGACVDFYGIHPNVKPDFAKLACPVLALFGETDPYVTPESARELAAAIKKAGRTCETHVYPKVGHAFFNDTRPEAYNKDAAEDAWNRTLAFFKQHLK
mgnify:CR=1 FL=1